MAFGDRRKPLKRTEFKRKTSRPSAKKPSKQAAKPRKKVAQKSTKTAARDRHYLKIRKVWLPGRSCEMGLDCCSGEATEVQHLKKRSVAGALVCYVPNFMAACNACHAWATVNTAAAEELGLMVKSWTALPAENESDNRAGTCGTCAQPVFWSVDIETGFSVPLDAEDDLPKLVPNGEYVGLHGSIPGQGELQVYLLPDHPEPCFRSHLKTCGKR